MLFKDRTPAEQLAAYVNRLDVVVLALPREGVPLAFEVATTLKLQLRGLELCQMQQ
jgi:putative phosphoribosyl transferase